MSGPVPPARGLRGRVPVSLRELMAAHDAAVAEAQAKHKQEHDADWKPYHRIRKDTRSRIL